MSAVAAATPGAADAATLLLQFARVSLLGVGGVMTLVPELHRVLVEQWHWLDDAQFTAAIAIAQAAPGPNFLFAAVLGLQAAGIAGALASVAGILGPSSALALAAAHWGERRRDSAALRAFRGGMAPVSLALLLSTGWVLTAAPPHWTSIALTAASALLAWRSRIHLLWLILAGGAIGAAGWL